MKRKDNIATVKPDIMLAAGTGTEAVLSSDDQHSEIKPKRSNRVQPLTDIEYEREEMNISGNRMGINTDDEISKSMA